MIQLPPIISGHRSRRSVPSPSAAFIPSPQVRRWLELAQYPLIAAAALAAAYSATIGQLFVLAYALFALTFRRSSRASFGAALFILITIPLFEAIHQAGIAQNAAIYVYELLVIGTIQAIVELRKADKTHK